MNVFRNAASQVDCIGIDERTTVQDLLDAVDMYIQDHPLPCHDCANGCCRKPWAVEVDNVAACRIAGTTVGDFVRDRMMPKWNHALGFRQFVLKKGGECPLVSADNRCTIYEKRPVICRLYLCAPKSDRYNYLREVVAATYLQALVFEQNMRDRQFSARTLAKYRRNPAVGADDYSLPLQAIILYAQRMGWLDEQDGDSLRNCR